MPVPDKLAWEILNATADDWESLEQILQSIPAGTATQEIVVNRIVGLAEAGLLSARVEDSAKPLDHLDQANVGRAWFAMTEAGRAAWSDTDHEVLVD